MLVPSQDEVSHYARGKNCSIKGDLGLLDGAFLAIENKAITFCCFP